MLGISVILSYAVFVYLCFCEFVFVYLCICICVYVYFTVQNIMFDVLGPLAFQKYSTCWVFLSFCHMLYLCICVFCEFVFVYLYICICVYVNLTAQNIMFEVLGPLAFQKYNTCWVFPALHLRLYLCICEFVCVYLCI